MRQTGFRIFFFFAWAPRVHLFRTWGARARKFLGRDFLARAQIIIKALLWLSGARCRNGSITSCAGTRRSTAASRRCTCRRKIYGCRTSSCIISEFCCSLYFFFFFAYYICLPLALYDLAAVLSFISSCALVIIPCCFWAALRGVSMACAGGFFLFIYAEWKLWCLSICDVFCPYWRIHFWWEELW